MGFKSRFPEARRNYTIFEKQLLTCHWALIDMETIDCRYYCNIETPSANHAVSTKFTENPQD